MVKEKKLFKATICYLMRGDEVCLAVKKRKIGVGLLNGYGGGPKPGESLKRAACRELREECGVRAQEKDLELVAICHFENETEQGEKFTCNIRVYRLKKWSGEPTESTEMGPPEWTSIHHIPNNRLMPADPFWLPFALKGEKIEVFARYGPHQKTLLGKVVIKSLTK